jgi:hypothetical protein
VARKGRAKGVSKKSSFGGQVSVNLPAKYSASQGGSLISGMRMTLRTESSGKDVSALKKGPKV